MSRAKSELLPIQSAMPAVLVEVLKSGSLSSAKIEFAWKAAVGNALARVTTARLRSPQTVEVTAADERWVRELRRSAPMIVARLKALLGPEVLTRIEIVSAPSDRPSRVMHSTRAPNPQSQIPDPDK